jgi:hypothetical protein
MYVLGPGIKGTPRQWALPDRVFFAAGACQVLAYVALGTLAGEGFRAKWIRPAAGHRGNHIIVTDGAWAFDYHGWTQLECLLAHTRRKAERWWPGWTCEVLDFPTEALVSEQASKALGLHLREPGQFTHDALPRARTFFARHGARRLSAAAVPPPGPAAGPGSPA